MSDKQLLADEILRRIALRYKNCQVHIFPELPELTPVEGVLRCAQEEGFILTSMASGLSTTVYIAHPPTDPAAAPLETIRKLGENLLVRTMHRGYCKPESRMLTTCECGLGEAIHGWKTVWEGAAKEPPR